MKTKLIKRVSNLFAILAFLAFFAGNAFAITNATSVVSPYWQSDSGSYTFIAVTHSSLSGMASQIGLVINAIKNDKTAYGAAVEFTIQEGTTTRVFITRTGHPTLNPTALPTAKFIQGTTDFSHGHVVVTPKATLPATAVTGNSFGKFSRCTDKDDCASHNTHLHGGGFRDSTMLSYWGAVVMESNTTGFAMEFIGDMADSKTASAIAQAAGAYDYSIPPQGPNAP